MHNDTKSKFNKFVKELFGVHSTRDNTVEETWTMGGLTGGSCWSADDGADTPVDPDPEPELGGLDKLLEIFYPNITYLQYKKLVAEIVQRETYRQSEYYGNCYVKGVKKFNIDVLCDYLDDACPNFTETLDNVIAKVEAGEEV